MRRLLILPVLAMALAAPAAAAEAPLTDCGDTTGLRVVQLGTSAAPIATPADPLYLSSTTEQLILVLPEGEGQPTSAAVGVTLSWGGPSDFDLNIAGPNGEASSLGTNALEGNTETADAGPIAACDVIDVSVMNFAGLPTEALTLTVTAQ